MQARLERMKARLFRESYCKKEWWGDDLSIFDADPSLAAKPRVIRNALAVRKVLEGGWRQAGRSVFLP